MTSHNLHVGVYDATRWYKIHMGIRDQNLVILEVIWAYLRGNSGQHLPTSTRQLDKPPTLQCRLLRPCSYYLKSTRMHPFQNWFAKPYTPKNRHQISPLLAIQCSNHSPALQKRSPGWFLCCSGLLWLDRVQQTFWGWLFCSRRHSFRWVLPSRHVVSTNGRVSCALTLWRSLKQACWPPNLANNQWRGKAALGHVNLWMSYHFLCMHASEWREKRQNATICCWWGWLREEMGQLRGEETILSRGDASICHI